MKQFGQKELLNVLMPEMSPYRAGVKFSVIMLALAFMIFALAQPQVGTKLQDVKREGVELILALDVSNSMLAEDIKPNRLDNAKRSISKLIDKLNNDKLGLIVFAGDAYTQLPITTDYKAAKMFLATVNTGFVQKQGTAIGSAIDLAMNSFSPDNESSKAMILITDGENHEDDAIEMAKEAREKGVNIHVIGMGLPKGAPIPVKGRIGQYRKDKTGQTVISKLNEPMLQQIAMEGGGVYIRANNAQSGLKILFDEINKMDKQELESNIYSEYDDKFQYPLAAAILLLLIEFAILNRKNRLLKNVQIFK